MIRFVLCDDNFRVLERLSKMLESIFITHDIEADVVFQNTSPNAILEYIESHQVDVLLLDINLKSNISGCDLAEIIRKKDSKMYFIFNTAHLEYALIAYKYKTFDFLPKPITEERLEETILRLVDDMKEPSSPFIRINNGTIINKNEVNYIKKDGMKLVFCTDNSKYETHSSFIKFQSCLPDNFVRCHKSYIVNTEKITDVKSSQNTIFFSDSQQCSIGAKYRLNFMEVLKNGNLKNVLDSTFNGG